MRCKAAKCKEARAQGQPCTRMTLRPRTEHLLKICTSLTSTQSWPCWLCLGRPSQWLLWLHMTAQVGCIMVPGVGWGLRPVFMHLSRWDPSTGPWRLLPVSPSQGRAISIHPTDRNRSLKTFSFLLTWTAVSVPNWSPSLQSRPHPSIPSSQQGGLSKSHIWHFLTTALLFEN